MKTKHTRGKWYKSSYDSTTDASEFSINVYAAKDQHPKVAKMVCGSVEEQLANAKLIAAAPELLEALKNAIYIIDTKLNGYGVDELKEVIKKATPQG